MRAIFALAVIGMLAAMPARADVTYDFVVTSATPGYSNFPGAVLSAGSVVGRLSIPDNIVAQGTLTATPCNVYVNGPECQLPNEGWPEGVFGGIGMTGIPGPSNIYPEGIPPYAPPIEIAFNPDGTLSGHISIEQDEAAALLSGSGRDWSGKLESDLNGANWDIESGYWYTRPNNLPHPCCGHGPDPDPDPVPEPSSLALILPAIGAMVGLCRRRRLPA
ncbi:MAG TPA: PEP-CTERM sorting domain-containing protein [Stellaceae bacterium]|nr:PEP-CTERM sorting domain-containing protein [Stellaceae bacterium]